MLSKVLSRSRLKKFGGVLYAIIYTPVILSPVVSGLGLLFFWGRKGMIGEHLYHLGIIIPFTPTAVILAQTFVALPFFVATAVTTLQAIPEEYEQIARVEGAKSSEITYRVLLPLAAPGIATAFLLSSHVRSANSAPPSPSRVMCRAKLKLFRSVSNWRLPAEA